MTAATSEWTGRDRGDHVRSLRPAAAGGEEEGRGRAALRNAIIDPSLWLNEAAKPSMLIASSIVTARLMLDKPHTNALARPPPTARRRLPRCAASACRRGGRAILSRIDLTL